jgi:hypothetical protein
MIGQMIPSARSSQHGALLAVIAETFNRCDRSMSLAAEVHPQTAPIIDHRQTPDYLVRRYSVVAHRDTSRTHRQPKRWQLGQDDQQLVTPVLSVNARACVAEWTRGFPLSSRQRLGMLPAPRRMASACVEHDSQGLWSGP